MARETGESWDVAVRKASGQGLFCVFLLYLAFSLGRKVTEMEFKYSNSIVLRQTLYTLLSFLLSQTIHNWGEYSSINLAISARMPKAVL